MEKFRKRQVLKILKYRCGRDRVGLSLDLFKLRENLKMDLDKFRKLFANIEI